MYPLTLLLLMGLSGAIASAVCLLAGARAKTTLVFGGMTVGTAFFTLLVAFIGHLAQLRSLDDAIAHVNPADQEIIRIQGERDARVPLYFGALGAVLPLLAGGGTVVVGLMRLEKR